ncbi:hypothetical protein, partial [Mesorhizobium sp. M3A.F.Ca.ET.175.01.1.1]|uniref:hypothetical protein n=1 Tax=Mesorhizobium sp. M3A.F.Ca.ET.175.01.1.1 TaxID=2563945 RepID=UPI001AEEBEBE
MGAQTIRAAILLFGPSKHRRLADSERLRGQVHRSMAGLLTHLDERRTMATDGSKIGINTQLA